MSAGKVYNRDVRITGGGALYVNEVKVIDESGNIDAPVTTTNLTTTGNTTLGDASGDTNTFNATTTALAPFTVGVDDTGHDVKFFGATAGKSWLWDESADTMIVTGAATISETLGVTGDLTVNGGQSALNFTDNGAVGATFTLFQDSASPASPDEVGIVAFDGRDDGAGANTYATISGVIDDPSAGATFGSVAVQVQNGTGSLEPAAIFAHDGSTATLETGLITTEANVGTAAADVTAAEYGDGKSHTTVLTISGMTIPVAGAAAEAIGKLLYTFPAGAHVHEVTSMSVALQGTGTVDADTPDVGIGSVIATGAVSLLNGTATFEDYITGQTATNCNGAPTGDALGPVGATAGILTGISLNKTTDAKTVHLNVADTWAGADTLTVSGTVTLKWTNM